MILENLELLSSSRGLVKIKKSTQKLKLREEGRGRKRKKEKTALPPSLRGGILSLGRESSRYLGGILVRSRQARSRVRHARELLAVGVSGEKARMA